MARSCLLLALLAVLFEAASARQLLGPKVAPSPIKAIVVIGDSLSDPGNLFKYSNGTVPDPSPTKGYKLHRFSSGKVWADYMPDHLGKDVAMINFAFGSSTATAISLANYAIPDAKSQVDMWEAVLSNATTIPPAADRLAVLWTGANDIFYIGRAMLAGNGSQVNATAVLEAATRSLLVQGDRLLMLGARGLVLGQMPRLSWTPFGASLPPLALEVVDAWVGALNDGIRGVRDALQAKWQGKAKVVLYSVEDLLTIITAQPARFGFTHLKESCLVGKMNGTPVYMPGGEVVSLCKKPFKYLFFDDVHPTDKAHKLTAKDMYLSWKAAGLVP